jgi:hypothetical protein
MVVLTIAVTVPAFTVIFADAGPAAVAFLVSEVKISRKC